MACRRQAHGFTLIELLVTVVVLSIIIAIAVPSFRSMAERSALRGASDGIEGVIANAKEESIKRDRTVWVAVKSGGGRFCAGAATAATGCDCLAEPAACDVDVWPTSERDQKKVEVHSVSFGSGDRFGFDPKTGTLSDPADTGGVTLKTDDYAVRLVVSPVGRVSLCKPSVSGTNGISGLGAC